MNTVKVDFSHIAGDVKPMHSVNNGPSGSRVRSCFSNFKYFEEACIPYARTHDASFYTGYGGEFTVDVHRIFRNFEADVNDPASYDFEVTDRYLQDIESVGTKVFYRLGASIEHGKKVGTFPPADFQKWAEICEHIILHYTQGWANGFEMDIEYWEIWNEPDCTNADGSNPCWQGTKEQFVEFFVTALRHLKARFPHLKIGGPAFCSSWNDEYNALLLSAVKANGLPLDFYSFHAYAKEPDLIRQTVQKAHETVREFGFENSELILNEWNYVRGWLSNDFEYSTEQIQSLKGASFIASTMCVGQNGGLDHLMYYDARPCSFNGMFDRFQRPIKGYYPFKMFSTLYGLKNSVIPQTDDKTVYTTAAIGEDEAALMISYFDDNDQAPAKDVAISFAGLPDYQTATVEYYVLDDDHNAEIVRSEIFTAPQFTSYLKIGLYSTYLIRIRFTR